MKTKHLYLTYDEKDFELLKTAKQAAAEKQTSKKLTWEDFVLQNCGGKQ